METVGIRELRQNLSAYLRRVAEGERFIISERREPVAVLGPLPERDDPWERLIAEGRLTRPTRSLLEIGDPIEAGDPYAGTKALEEDRGDSFE